MKTLWDEDGNAIYLYEFTVEEDVETYRHSKHYWSKEYYSPEHIEKVCNELNMLRQHHAWETQRRVNSAVEYCRQHGPHHYARILEEGLKTMPKLPPGKLAWYEQKLDIHPLHLILLPD